MEYILVNWEDTEYWIEIKCGYAYRQIIIDSKNNVDISCKTDCLPEGIIKSEELEGKICNIDSETFERKWKSVCDEYSAIWEEDKRIYPCGTHIVGKVKYFFPQGVIIQIGTSLGVCDFKQSKEINMHIALSSGDNIAGVVEGYDETNMWLKIRTPF